MQLLGKKSLASILLSLINIAFYLVIIGLVVLIASIFYLGGADDLGSMAGTNLSLQGPGFSVKFFNIESEMAEKTGISVLITQLTLALPVVILALFILYKLRFLLDSLKRKDPFSPENPRHIRHMGIGIIIAGIVNSLAEGIAAYQLAPLISEYFPHYSTNVSLDLTTIFFGLLVLILSEVFRQGAQLKKEQEYTV